MSKIVFHMIILDAVIDGSADNDHCAYLLRKTFLVFKVTLNLVQLFWSGYVTHNHLSFATFTSKVCSLWNKSCMWFNIYLVVFSFFFILAFVLE